LTVFVLHSHWMGQRNSCASLTRSCTVRGVVRSPFASLAMTVRCARCHSSFQPLRRHDARSTATKTPEIHLGCHVTLRRVAVVIAEIIIIFLRFTRTNAGRSPDVGYDRGTCKCAAESKFLPILLRFMRKNLYVFCCDRTHVKIFISFFLLRRTHAKIFIRFLLHQSSS
jgi:hypothetical protein